ncbi:MAG: hypothetical protein QM520_01690 [Gammaproteobacteria bacterium]|nr:hypothetical protein [Gammaproteobacteria bacterium]
MQAFLQDLSRSPSVIEAAIADNCRFDERISAERWQAFLAFLPDPTRIGSFLDWQEASKLYYESKVKVSSRTTPDTFMPLNQQIYLKDLPNQTLVRLEALDWLLKSIWNLTMKEFQNLLVAATHDIDSQASVKQLFDDWNKNRDNRPCYAGFLDEVKAETEAADWPNQLRDRMGLGGYDPDTSEGIPVALMVYDLADVLTSQRRLDWPAAMALPTALDGGMHQFFFPVPKAHPYGATLHLGPGQAETLTAEILHARFDYQPKHLLKLGTISRRHIYPEDQATSASALRSARDVHLLSLRIASSRDDFGEDMEGRA